MKKEKKNPVVVVLDNIRSALNVGAIFRTCDATNIQKLCLCGITAYPPHSRIPKTALGATESVPWKHYKTTKDALLTIKNTTIVSVELTSNATNLWDYQFRPNTALVFGNEISGISKEILKKSDAVVKIPMFGSKKSLNIATSCGIVLYEVLRQLREESL
jgi:tRNA G18 (ribose-2'-O)-methylase SpoU